MPRQLPAARQYQLDRRRRREAKLQEKQDDDDVSSLEGSETQQRAPIIKKKMSWNQLEAELDKRMTPQPTLKERNRSLPLGSKQSKPTKADSSHRTPKTASSTSHSAKSQTLFRTQVKLPKKKAEEIKKQVVVKERNGDHTIFHLPTTKSLFRRKRSKVVESRIVVMPVATPEAIQQEWLDKLRLAIRKARQSEDARDDAPESLDEDSSASVFSDPDGPETDASLQLFGGNALTGFEQDHDDVSVASIELLFDWLLCNDGGGMPEDELKRFNPKRMSASASKKKKSKPSKLSRERSLTL